MLSELLSRNKSCADPDGEVWMRSLCITRAPTVSLSAAPPGGVPSLTGLTAVAVPTCCASAGPVAIRAAASGTMMNFLLMTRGHECLANDRQLSANHVGAAGLNQWRGAQIEMPDMRKYTDDQNKTCAQQADDYDLQVGLTISAIDPMIHSRLRFVN